MIEKHLPGICNYFENHTTNGLIEGMNTKIKQQCLGFFRKQLRLLKEAGLVQIIISKNNRWGLFDGRDGTEKVRLCSWCKEKVEIGKQWLFVTWCGSIGWRESGKLVLCGKNRG